jgi:hypothetical protein
VQKDNHICLFYGHFIAPMPAMRLAQGREATLPETFAHRASCAIARHRAKGVNKIRAISAAREISGDQEWHFHAHG